ncbi:MAG TPA: hypothetical protein VHF47_08445 [Acidimicrobiales bacterium]|nr:hypothetical protein [Acidimicrobiales bacterium]
MEQDPVVPGLVERVDQLTAAVADLGFRLDTLISSTSAFRDAVSDRLTDYADLVARWSMEAEDNVAAYRDTVAGLPAAVAAELTSALAKVERRTAEALEALEAAATRRLEAVGREVRGLREALAEAAADEGDGDPVADALAAVLAEMASLREQVRAVPRPEPVEIPPFPEIPPPPDLAPVVAELAAVREELAALRPAEVDATVEELRGLRREIARLPQGREELAALAEEVRGLRGAVAEAAADEVEDAEETEGALEALTAEVAALREALAAMQVRLDERPAMPPEVTALTAELQALRSEMQEAPDAPEERAAPVAAPPPDLEPIQDAIAELTFEVRALRKRLRLRAE